MTTDLGRLHVVIDVHPATGDDRDPLALAREVLDAGAPVVQLRCKGVADRQVHDLAWGIVDLASAADADVIVNDRADIAVAVGAAGVHVGEHDLPVDAARRIVGPDRLVGGTARDAARGAALAAAGASYLGVGPAYATRSKAGLPAAIGPSGIGAVAGAVRVPVIAIGGVTAAAVPALLAAGAWGVAVIGAVASAPSPGRAVKELLDALGRAA